MTLLSSEVLEWVKNNAETGVDIREIRPLTGTTSSELYEIKIGKENLVLRLFTLKEWLEEEPDLATHEANSLRYASNMNVPTPRLIAADENGSHCGIPAVLMTKVPGSVILQPKNLKNYVEQLAETMFQVHQLDVSEFPWHYFSYIDVSKVEIPKWSNHPDLWEKAVKIVKGPKPAMRECFIHRDFHPANVLWCGEKVSGVVDWPNACKGPVGADLGHCRVNLALLFGVKAANHFLDTYQSLAVDSFRYEPYYDLTAIFDFSYWGPPEVYAGWIAFGVDNLTNDMMAERADQFLASIMERVGYNED